MVVFKNRKISCRHRDSNPGPPIPQLITIPTPNTKLIDMFLGCMFEFVTFVEELSSSVYLSPRKVALQLCTTLVLTRVFTPSLSLSLSHRSHFSCLFSLSLSVAQMKQKSEDALLSNNSSHFPGLSTCSVPLTHRTHIGPLDASRCSHQYKNLFAIAVYIIVILEQKAVHCRLLAGGAL